MAFIDTEKQRQITDILDQIDQGVDPSVLSNNLNALSGSFGDTQAGRLILAAMQQYAGENSSVIKTSAAQAQYTLAEEEKRKKREQLYATLDALNDYEQAFDAWFQDAMARLEKNIETLNAMTEVIPQIRVASAELSTSLEAAYKEPSGKYAEKLEQLDSIDHGIEFTSQKLEAAYSVLTQADETLKEKKQQKEEMLQKGQDTSVIDAEIFELVTTTDAIAEAATVTAVQLENFMHQKIVLVQEALASGAIQPENRQNVEENLEKFIGNYNKLHELQVKFRDDNLSVSDKREIAKEIDRTIDKARDIVETYKATIDPQSEGASQAFAAIEDMQNTLNQQQEALNVAQQNLINAQIYTERLTDINNKYESRTDFLDAHHGGSFFGFIGRHLDNLSDYIFDSHDPDDHVQTKDGDFVFHNNETGEYYFYPGNDPSASPQEITDPVEIIEIGLQATAAYSPKFFANETSLGANYEGLLDNFTNAATTEQNTILEEEKAKAEVARQQKELEEQQQAEAAAQQHATSPQTQMTSTSFASKQDPIASKAPKLSQTFASTAAPDPATNNPDYTPAQPTEEHTQTSSLPQRTA